MAYKGKYSPKNPKKYRGDPTGIIYRSLWELKVMKYLDDNRNVLEWCSEEVAIPYISPVDNRPHRYFPDFIAVMLKPDGTTKTVMIEVKPKAQTKEPKIPTKKTRRYLTEVMTWGVNNAKWKAAQEYCLDRQWEFRLITEVELGIK
tara:strand:+ start:122 stop:559 length:438 start_codon:yes stop_codon:yes gene_type:complete